MPDAPFWSEVKACLMSLPMLETIPLLHPVLDLDFKGTGQSQYSALFTDEALQLAIQQAGQEIFAVAENVSDDELNKAPPMWQR